MLEIDEATLNAMFSTLGLQVKTVAGPLGNCNRQARIKKDVLSPSSTLNVLLSQTVANGGMSRTLEEVWLYSDIHRGGRGPPSFYSLSRSLIYLYNVALLMPVVSRISLIGMVPVS